VDIAIRQSEVRAAHQALVQEIQMLDLQRAEKVNEALRFEGELRLLASLLKAKPNV